MSVNIDPKCDKAVEVALVRPLRYFLWKRPFAQLLWIACVAFWGGAGLSLWVTPLALLFDNAAAGLLYSVLFPPLVFLYLLMSWLRQEIDAGRIVLRPSPPPPTRSISGFSDPMSDPLDPRSPLHRQHFHKHRR